MFDVEVGEFIEVITYPLKKMALTIFSLEVIEGISLGSLIIVGLLFVFLTAIIMHGGFSGVGRILSKWHNHKTANKDSANRPSDADMDAYYKHIGWK